MMPIEVAGQLRKQVEEDLGLKGSLGNLNDDKSAKKMKQKSKVSDSKVRTSLLLSSAVASHILSHYSLLRL